MKKLMTVFLMLAILVSLCACGQTTPATPSPTASR